MKRAALVLGSVAFLLGAGGCVSNPKKTVLNLDTTDPKWTSRDCYAARKAVAKYHDGDMVRSVVGFAGDHALPYAGTGASLLLSQRQDHKRAEMNKWVKEACVSQHHHWL